MHVAINYGELQQCCEYIWPCKPPATLGNMHTVACVRPAALTGGRARGKPPKAAGRRGEDPRAFAFISAVSFTPRGVGPARRALDRLGAPGRTPSDRLQHAIIPCTRFLFRGRRRKKEEEKAKKCCLLSRGKRGAAGHFRAGFGGFGGMIPAGTTAALSVQLTESALGDFALACFPNHLPSGRNHPSEIDQIARPKSKGSIFNSLAGCNLLGIYFTLPPGKRAGGLFQIPV